MIDQRLADSISDSDFIGQEDGPVRHTDCSARFYIIGQASDEFKDIQAGRLTSAFWRGRVDHWR
jgi:hypothetical protein